MIEFVSSLISVIAFYFAFYTWEISTISKRAHVYKILNKQISCLGPWIDTEYGSTLTEAELFDNANPYKQIYSTALEPLINLTLLESINEMPENIIGEVYELYLDLLRIQNLQEARNLLLNASPTVAENIQRSREQHIKNYGENDWQKFFSSLSGIEQHYLHLYINYSTALHCVVIGNKNRGARQHYDRIKEWLSTPKTPYYLPIIVLTISLPVVLGILIGIGFSTIK